MLPSLNTTILSFRSCFSRNHSFHWFVIVIIGLMVRSDHLGITSIIRELNLDPRFYTTFMHFFRSKSWSLEKLGARWIKIVIDSVERPTVNGMNILIGDGIKVSKEGRKMPGVKKLHQESENSGKAEYMFGHLFGVVGILVGNSSKQFCIALNASVQDGVSKIREFADSQHKAISHVVHVITQAGTIAEQIGPSCIILDRYFLSVPAITKLKSYVDESGKQLLHMIAKAKMSMVAYADPPAYSGRGPRPKKGEPIKIKALFETKKGDFTSAQVFMYGKMQDIEYYCIDLLWGQKLYQKVRIVLVTYNGIRSILVCTSLDLSALQIIQQYSYRFKIEIGFKEMKYTIGAFAYHFWSKSMPKLNRFFKDINVSALEAITESRAKSKIAETLRAIEGYVFMAIISLGLLQILSLKFSKQLNMSSFRWLRTKTNQVVSEATVAYYFRKNIYRIMETYSHLGIMQIIKSKQNEEFSDEYLDAS